MHLKTNPISVPESFIQALPKGELPRESSFRDWAGKERIIRKNGGKIIFFISPVGEQAQRKTSIRLYIQPKHFGY